MTLYELLEELKQVDLETYRKWFNDYDILGLDQWQLDSLQGCIQRACEKREWSITLSFNYDLDRTKTWMVEICDNEWTVIGITEGYDSAVESLLVAYITAVKEEKQLL